MTIDIRVLRSEDAPVLDRIAPGVFDDPIIATSANKFLNDPHHHLVVATENDTVVGFASAVHYVHPDKQHPELWINEVGVAPTHQSRGIGKGLMHAMLRIAEELGCTEAWVLTERTNIAATRLYQSSGGREGSDNVVMFTFPLPPTGR